MTAIYLARRLTLVLALEAAACHAVHRPPSLKESADLLKLHRQANSRANAGQWQAAGKLYEQAYRLALNHSQPALAGRYLSNLGNVYSVQFEYREALESFMRAQQLVKDSGDREGVRMVSANLAILYIQIGDFPAARAAAAQALRVSDGRDLLVPRAHLLFLLGMACAGEGDPAKADEALYAAVEASKRTGDRRLQAQASDYLGFVLLKRQPPDLKTAESALTEAQRLLPTGDPDTAVVYTHLSELRERQGNLQLASTLLAQAFKAGRSELPAWYLHFRLGKILSEEHLHLAALREFRRTAGLAWQWRGAITPSDNLRSGSSHWLSDFFEAYLDELMADRAFERPGSRVSLEAFQIAEVERSAVLRQTLLDSEDWRGNLPPEYWRTLARLRQCQSALLANAVPGLKAEAAALSQHAAEIEAAALGSSGGGAHGPPENFPAGNTLRDIQQRLASNELLVSFHLGTQASCVWAVTRRRFEVHRLAPGERIRDDARKFRVSIHSEAPEAERLGSALFSELFGSLSRGALAQPAWVVAAGELVIGMPFAALREGAGKGHYLAENHSVHFVPSALMVRPSGDENRTGNEFLGIGDGIYNQADPRWKESETGNAMVARAAVIELPRLVGSGQELAACARAWRRNATLLTGWNASRVALTAELQRGPAVIHLAAHILQPNGHPEEALVSFGIGRDGVADVMTRYDIANLRLKGGTVVMNGCSSALAPAPDGTGLLGLVRAWLIAGADSVVGSRWASPDDTGAFFQAFYVNLSGAPRSGMNRAASPALALQAAQLAMLRSGSWRARPKYWSSFYEMGKE